MNDTVSSELLDWAYVNSKPNVSGLLRASPEDFFVDEVLGFEPDGEGEHLLVQVEKRNTNTDWLARQLVRLSDVKPMAVSYAGLKDRNAVTRQWFSIQLAGKPVPDFSSLEAEGVSILRAEPHRRKLRRGALRGNRFSITVRDLQGPVEELEERLATVAAQGVPNYFGEQRFGRDYANLDQALAMFQGTIRVRDRHKRGLYISAARSLLFNLVLSRRVEAGSWNRLLPGELVMLDGSRNHFFAESIDAELQRRLEEGDIHPSGPLWGGEGPRPATEAMAVEMEVLAGLENWLTGLERVGLEQERRPLRLPVRELNWQLTGEALELSFYLPAGSYATTVLREIVQCREPVA